jgi:hypothetical protein
LARRDGKHRQGVIFACAKKLESLGGKGFILNLQPDKNGQAKAYQVRQVRRYLTLLFGERPATKKQREQEGRTLK